MVGSWNMQFTTKPEMKLALPPTSLRSSLRVVRTTISWWHATYQDSRLVSSPATRLTWQRYYKALGESGILSVYSKITTKVVPQHNIDCTYFGWVLLISTRYNTNKRMCVCVQHEWKYADGRFMTREDFMDILFYVDYILIKASHGSLMRHSQ